MQTISIDDTTFPTLICPANASLEGCSEEDLQFAPSFGNLEYSEVPRIISVTDIQNSGGNAGDNCGIDSLYYVDSRSGECPLTVTRVFTVMDSCGNSLSCTQEISIDDTTDPILLCPSDVTVEACFNFRSFCSA